MAETLLVSQPAAAPVRVVSASAGLRRQLTLLPLVMIFFFTVCGGAYGLEPLVKESGPGMALLLVLVTPLIWAVPAALMVAELSSAMPVEGGYYAWVKKGLGSFWAFQEGWWSWLSSFVDMAIYPVLFGKYLAALLGDQFGIGLFKDSDLARWLVGLVVIWVFTWLNIRGVRPVGTSSILFGLLVLAPFAAMVVVGVLRYLQTPVAFWQPLTAGEGSATALDAFGAGLFVVMWNYQGWDSVSPANGEVRQPRRAVPWAMWLALPLVVLAYLLPTAAGLIATPDAAQWEEGAFPAIAAALGGQWLGTWLAIGGLVSAAALFSANLLSTSRIPFVMADDGYLPRALTRLHPRFRTPWIALLLCSVIYSISSWSAFSTLVVIDVVLYAASLLLEFLALIALRLSEPGLRRPYRVPGGWSGVMLITLLPMVILALAVVNELSSGAGQGQAAGSGDESGASALLLSAVALVSGPVLYPFCRLLFKRGRPDIPVVAEDEAPPEPVSPWLTGQVGSVVPAAAPRWRP